jgi:hypothetical protein
MEEGKYMKGKLSFKTIIGIFDAIAIIIIILLHVYK